MINNVNYSIKETSNAWGVDLNKTPTPSSLKKIIESIKNVANSNVEVATPGPLNRSNIRVCGRVKQPSANGHLILNPEGVDVRIIPGKINNVEYENVSGDRYKARFKDCDSNDVMSMSFTSNEKIDRGVRPVYSRQIQMKNIDSQKSIEELWRGMTDPHHFYPMLQQLGISKLDAFRRVPPDLASRVDTDSLGLTLQNIHKRKDNIMAFVGNNAVVQIYTGPVLKIAEVKGSDKIFIHGVTKEGEPAVINLSKKDIAQAWVVNKRSNDGYITSLEIFDHQENHIAQFYGVRKEGQKQNENWHKLMKELPTII
ncbi:Hemin transport protein hemS [Cedecea davisae]|uniref:Hemin-degrading family protein n=1 Tax=Cedecea davisae DSM 4568 TaxID=566551 RepID=S3IVJ6_9ENTR|nr:ChuX/HutX family heme-like substrate-binding protein [Cedecea davisae]EPF16985.1 Hemin-degrading family protein [Cedecea davisae DSM 4568]STA45155.1 Hemin transport protein hemS [Cedecea davisae]